MWIDPKRMLWMVLNNTQFLACLVATLILASVILFVPVPAETATNEEYQLQRALDRQADALERIAQATEALARQERGSGCP